MRRDPRPPVTILRPQVFLSSRCHDASPLRRRLPVGEEGEEVIMSMESVLDEALVARNNLVRVAANQPDSDKPIVDIVIVEALDPIR